MVSAVLISTAVTGALLLAIVAAVTGEQRWRPVPAASAFRRQVREGRGGERGPVSSLVHSIVTWEFLFALLLVVAVGTVLLAAGGSAGAVGLFGAFLAVLVLGFLVVGVYTFALERGHSAALATAEAAVAFGFLLLLAITARLVTG